MTCRNIDIRTHANVWKILINRDSFTVFSQKRVAIYLKDVMIRPSKTESTSDPPSSLHHRIFVFEVQDTMFLHTARWICFPSGYLLFTLIPREWYLYSVRALRCSPLQLHYPSLSKHRSRDNADSPSIFLTKNPATVRWRVLTKKQY